MNYNKMVMEYSSNNEALGRLQMKAVGGRISVFSPISFSKGQYFLSND